MGMVFADPDMLDRLAKSLDSKAGAIPQLMSRATALGVSGEVSGLTAIGSWLRDTARDLRRRATILRTPSESPFDSLSAFGLPTALAKSPGAGKNLDAALQKILDEHARDAPTQRAQAIKDYFVTLSPEQQAALAAADPKAVGNLDGVPVDVRFAANRLSIQKEFNEESKFLKGLAPNDAAYKRTKDRVDALRTFLDPRIKSFVDPKTNKVTQVEVPRQFLVFDAHFGSTADPKSSPFPDGRVAEVVGDLEHSKNVAFRVPGITNRLDNFNGFSNGGYELAQNSQGIEQPDTAVVSWLGYDTPEIGDSVDPAKAVVGGNALSAFDQGISVNLEPGATKNIFAHSYGTLVTSKALQNGLTDAANVTFMGSPGLGPNIHSVADFHLPDTKFYAMRAPKDPVSYTQGLGDDPADFKDITRLGTTGSTGHSQYYNRGTASLSNMQSLLFGDTKQLTFTHTTLDEEMTGAAEIRELVAFLHERVPADVVSRMGGDLDPIVQNYLNGRCGLTDIIRPLNSVLNKHNMLDKVKPEALVGEIKNLAGDLAYKQAFKEAKAHGAPDAVAEAAGVTAKLASKPLLDLTTFPVLKVLEFDRLQNNARQLYGNLATGGKEMFRSGSEMATGLKKDGGRILGDGLDIGGDLLHGGGNAFSELGDTLVHPSHTLGNVTDTIKSLDDSRVGTVEKGESILGSLNNAKSTVLDKGGDVISSGLDTGKKTLSKGKDVLDSAANFVF
ncbi:alpha/beta hydrolase [Streptomyces sp. NBC_00455]|uniref:alpha/beta hydrolase n=1 Tax=Streptomyces sp. NBC_00455 TaxID=2903654 RepID=UPI002E216654